ncbi:hypothetical protein AB7M33_003781 [Pseudomonas sp. Y3 TE3536]
MRGQSPEAWPKLDVLATMLGVSYSTLQRRLLAEGLSYQRRLKDNLRRDIAMLSQPGLTVTGAAQ